MKNQIKTLAIAFAFIAVLTACETVAPPTDFSGKLISKSDCKSGSFIVESEIGDTLSCIEYDYEDGVLNLRHINAGFNCCPEEIFTAFLLNKDTITVTESEKEHGCRCNCLYDLNIEILGITAKTYYLKIIEPYSGEQEKLITKINLSDEKEGSFCVARKQYPWGTSQVK